MARASAECAGGRRIDGELPASGLEFADPAGRVFSRDGGGCPGRASDGKDRRRAAGDSSRRLGVDRRKGSGEALQGGRHRLCAHHQLTQRCGAAGDAGAGLRRAGGADGGGQLDGRGSGDGRRAGLQPVAVQPRDAGGAADGFVLQAVRVYGGDRKRRDAGGDDRGHAGDLPDGGRALTRRTTTSRIIWGISRWRRRLRSRGIFRRCGWRSAWGCGR